LKSSLSAPGKKMGKPMILLIFWEGVGGYVRVFWGGFWMVSGGVFRGGVKR